MPALSNLGREGRVSYTRNNILFYVFMGESVSSRGSRGLQIICFAAIIQDPSATLPSVAISNI